MAAALMPSGLTASTRRPPLKWFIAVTRLSQGNFSNVKGVGGGVYEYKIDFGPGYRLYFGRDGERVILLLGGGSKKRQQKDIADAQRRWQDYKKGKKQEVR